MYRLFWFRLRLSFLPDSILVHIDFVFSYKIHVLYMSSCVFSYIIRVLFIVYSCVYCYISWSRVLVMSFYAKIETFTRFTCMYTYMYLFGSSKLSDGKIVKKKQLLWLTQDIGAWFFFCAYWCVFDFLTLERRKGLRY